MRFITVDDDPVNNVICKLTIEMVASKPDIVTFTEGTRCLEYIQSTYTANQDRTNTIILLDLNMPVMSGWEFLELFDHMADEVKKVFKIYILSSSVDPRDKERSYSNKNVSAFMVKPLVKENVVDIIK